MPGSHAPHPADVADVPGGTAAKPLAPWPALSRAARNSAHPAAARVRLSSRANGRRPRAARAAFTSASASAHVAAGADNPTIALFISCVAGVPGTSLRYISPSRTTPTTTHGAVASGHAVTEIAR